MTSPPGFVLVSALVLAVAGLSPESTVGREILSVGAVALLTTSMLLLAARLRPLSGARRLGLALGVGLSAPTVAGVSSYYHPEDVLAAALAAGGIRAVIAGKPVRAGALLGAAIVTRQWAVVLLIPAAGFSGQQGRRLLASAAAVVGIVLAPFALINSAGLEVALKAGAAVVGVDGVWSHFGLALAHPYAVSRVMPLVVAAATGGWIIGRWQRARRLGNRVSDIELVGACLAMLSTRVVFDTANIAYYAIPTVGLLVVIGICDERRWVRRGALAAAGLTELVRLGENVLLAHYGLGADQMIGLELEASYLGSFLLGVLTSVVATEVPQSRFPETSIARAAPS